MQNQFETSLQTLEADRGKRSNAKSVSLKFPKA